LSLALLDCCGGVDEQTVASQVVVELYVVDLAAFCVYVTFFLELAEVAVEFCSREASFEDAGLWRHVFR
jgi:hypothetical protein